MAVTKVDDAYAFLSKITELGKAKKEVKINDDLSLTLETLTAEDEVELNQACNGYSGLAYFTKSKIETVVMSIKAVNKIRFNYDEAKTDEEKIQLKIDALEKIRKIIGTWHDDVISFVHTEYLKLAVESEGQLRKIGILKNIEVEDKLKEQAEENRKEEEEDKKEK
jgi:hypothetical protein